MKPISKKTGKDVKKNPKSTKPPHSHQFRDVINKDIRISTNILTLRSSCHYLGWINDLLMAFPSGQGDIFQEQLSTPQDFVRCLCGFHSDLSARRSKSAVPAPCTYPQTVAHDSIGCSTDSMQTATSETKNHFRKAPTLTQVNNL